MSIVVDGLLKEYGTQKAVNNISFSVEKGEIVGFLGPNGAGKSTTMKMITGYLSPNSGIALVCGIDVAKNPNDAKKHIGYLPESNALYYEMYVMEYLQMVAHMYGIKDAKTVDEVIIKVGLLPEYKKKIGQLSKGYKQRVGIAAALIHNPDVLILDEPTSGLDPNQIIEIREVIKEVGKDKTVLFSSHILQEIEAICNRVIIINKGTLIADNSLTNILATKTTSRLQVIFATPVPEGVFDSITNATKVNSTTWSFAQENVEATKKSIMQIALEKDLSIVSMTQEQKNLEAVFRALTKK
jgi:ABC-2 type transport system ATP-binding protein